MFSVVVPVLNGAVDIRRTLDSVFAQEGAFDVHIHVQDGGSTDATLATLADVQRGLRDGSVAVGCRELKLTFSSATDAGMYDALLTGVRQIRGADDSPMTWINAGDYFLPGAFQSVHRIFSGLAEVAWLVPPVLINVGGKLKPVRQMEYPREIVAAGLCDGRKWPTIQQEGSFWRRRLWPEAETTFGSMKLAGDWYLWREFARSAVPYHMTRPIAVFAVAGGQLSASSKKYQQEIARYRPKVAGKTAFSSLVEGADQLRVAVVDEDCKVDWRALGVERLIEMGSREELLVAIAKKAGFDVAEEPDLVARSNPGAAGVSDHRGPVYATTRKWYRLLPYSFRRKLRPLIRGLFGR